MLLPSAPILLEEGSAETIPVLDKWLF